MQKALEHQEHAQHMAEHGGKNAALLIAVLAALLAVAEQQAKHADIKVEENAIFAADAWSQFQGKSTRQTLSQDLSQILAVLEPPNVAGGADPAFAQRRAALAKRLDDDAVKFQKDPKDGKDAIGERARNFEITREEALERAHSFDNAAAALELGIVLATASAITASTMLFRIAMLLGVAGLGLGILGLTFPALGAF